MVTMPPPSAGDPLRQVLVACVGNQLRGDDGFGPAVAARLHARLPAGVDLVETGTSGLTIIHHLMDGYRALVIVDAVERHARPGTVFVLEPDLPEIAQPTLEDWHAQYADPHLAEPSRLLQLARAADVLPDHVVIVGCQPERRDHFDDRLTDSVARALPIAAARVHELLSELLGAAAPDIG
jgi:hydrogenase maturation protease